LITEGGLLKKEYTDLILPIPRSGNYMRFEELAEMLRNHGVKENTISQIQKEILDSKSIDTL
jgi:hypothetical protein